MTTAILTATNNYHYQEKSIDNNEYVDELFTDVNDYLGYLSGLVKKEVRKVEEYNRNIKDNGEKNYSDDDDDGGDYDDDDSDEIRLPDAVYKFLEEYRLYYENLNAMNGKNAGNGTGFWKYSKPDEKAFNKKIQSYVSSTPSSRDMTKVDNTNALGLLDSSHDATVDTNNEAQDEGVDSPSVPCEGDDDSSAVRLLKLIKQNDENKNNLIKSSSYSRYFSPSFSFNEFFDPSNYSKWLISSSELFFTSSLFREKVFNNDCSNSSDGNVNNSISSSNSSSSNVVVDDDDSSNKEITSKNEDENVCGKEDTISKEGDKDENVCENEDTTTNKEKDEGENEDTTTNKEENGEVNDDKKIIITNDDNNGNETIQSKELTTTTQPIKLEKGHFTLIKNFLSFTKVKTLHPQISSTLWNRWEVI